MNAARAPETTPAPAANDADYLLDLSRKCGLREAMHAVDPQTARRLLAAFVGLLATARNEWKEAVLDALAAWPGMDFPIGTPPKTIIDAVLKMEREAAVALLPTHPKDKDQAIRQWITTVLDSEFVGLAPGEAVELQTTAPVTYEGLRLIFDLGTYAGRRMAEEEADEPMTEPFMVTGTGSLPSGWKMTPYGPAQSLASMAAEEGVKLPKLTFSERALSRIARAVKGGRSCQ